MSSPSRKRKATPVRHHRPARRHTDPTVARWAAGYGPIRHTPLTQARVRTMAERLRLQHEDLEAQVSERTRALEQQTQEAQATAALLRAQEAIQRGYGELAALLNSLDRSFVLGEGIRKIAAMRKRRTEAKASRIVAAQTGGVASFPRRIARKVLPQMSAQATKVTAMRMPTTVERLDATGREPSPNCRQRRRIRGWTIGSGPV